MSRGSNFANIKNYAQICHLRQGNRIWGVFKNDWCLWFMKCEGRSPWQWVGVAFLVLKSEAGSETRYVHSGYFQCFLALMNMLFYTPSIFLMNKITNKQSQDSCFAQIGSWYKSITLEQILVLGNKHCNRIGFNLFPSICFSSCTCNSFGKEGRNCWDIIGWEILTC